MNNNSLLSFNKILYLFIIVIVFGFAFVLLITRQQNNLADKVSPFNITTEVNKKLVAKDMDSIYPKYYVAFFFDSIYEVYSFNYYNTVSQFDLEFNRLMDSIVDYNRKDNMIRCYDLRGYGSYSYVKNNFSSIVGANNLEVYE